MMNKRDTWIFALALLGCTGNIGDGAIAVEIDTPRGEPPCETCVAPSKMMRITQAQYRGTIEAMFGAVDIELSLPGQTLVEGHFPVDDPGSTESDARTYAVAAEAVADEVAGEITLACDAASDAAACGVELADRYGTLAFRHAPTEEQRRLFGELFAWAFPEDGLVGATSFVISTMLQSPEFLFVPERVPESGEPELLRGEDLAARLSLFLWDAPPDDELLRAAEAGELSTRDEVLAQTQRMLDDPRASGVFRRFHLHWLVNRDRLPVLAPEVIDGMLEETGAFAEAVFADDASLRTLLSERETDVAPALAEFYGVGAGRVAVPGHRGIFTHASVLSTHSAPDWKRPIHRGLLVRESLLCLTTPPPVADDVLAGMDRADALSADASDRERLAAATESESDSCASCHRSINPPGYALENFDSLGRYREEDEHGNPIDAEGTISDGDVNGTFTDSESFLDLIVDSRLASDCVARQWMRYALRRDDDDQDRSSLIAVQDNFAETRDFRELLMAITGTESFRRRLVH